MKNTIRLLAFSFFLFFQLHTRAQNGMVVLQTDFGVKDGAVAAMKGVAMQVNADLKLFDLTHEIPAYNIWEAAFRLNQAAPYWPRGTVFVSVVDPGVGSKRKPVVLQTKSGHYFVSPDNGTLTLVAEALGVAAVREIDEKKNRLKGSEASYTFHGRDVFAYTAARLAARKISFAEVGPVLQTPMVKLNYQHPVIENNTAKGTIAILDVQYGNVWTNIDAGLLKQLPVNIGDTVTVKIFNDYDLVYVNRVPFVHSFSNVPEGHVLGYLNSLLQFSLAINMGNFAEKYRVASGEKWRIEVGK